MRKELPCTCGEIEELWEEITILHSEALGDIALHMEEVPVVDACTGFPDVLRDGETACVWLNEVMTLSFPPQNHPLLVAVNLPEEMPQLHEVAAVEGNTVVTVFGEELELRAETEFFPFRTRQIVTAADLHPGTRILVWGEAERVMVFCE